MAIGIIRLLVDNYKACKEIYWRLEELEKRNEDEDFDERAETLAYLLSSANIGYKTDARWEYYETEIWKLYFSDDKKLRESIDLISVYDTGYRYWKSDKPKKPAKRK